MIWFIAGALLGYLFLHFKKISTEGYIFIACLILSIIFISQLNQNY